MPALTGFELPIPDPEHALRWPLSLGTHPTLEPSFAIAAALAEPGIGWMELCKQGGANRFGGAKLRDLTTYLRAWCTVANGDRDSGVGMLAPLLASVTPQLAAAVRLDIVSILAHGSADEAEELMSKHRLVELERLDLLAGTYVELGKPADAYTINERALQSDRGTHREQHCRRLARALVLGSSDTRDVPLAKLRVQAEQEKADPACVELHRDLACWASATTTAKPTLGPALTSCMAYWDAHRVDPAHQKLFLAYLKWPTWTARSEEWFAVGELAAGTLALPGAEELAVRALEAVIEADECIGTVVSDARTLANKILHEPTRTRTVEDARLLRLVHRPRELCP